MSDRPKTMISSFAIATTESQRKGHHVLMIHGWAQNAHVMTSRTKSLVKKLNQAGYDCHFPNAPHELPMTSFVEIDGQKVEIDNHKRENARAWFLYSSQDASDASLAQSEEPMEYIGLDDGLKIIADAIRQISTMESTDRENYNVGNISVLGFSQGAVLVHILAALAQKGIQPFDRIRSFILISGFPANHEPPTTTMDDKSTLAGSVTIRKENGFQGLALPSLHVIGRQDHRVVPETSEKLASCFLDSTILYHDKGHMIPQKNDQCTDMIAFLDGYHS